MPAVKAPSAAPRPPKDRFHPPRDPGLPPQKSRSALFTLLLFFSGAAALIYQVLWIRELSIVVGIEVYSITIAVSAFFAGLAGGSAIFGRLADRWQRPLLLYCFLETGVALTGVTATILLSRAAEPFVLLQARTGLLAWLLPFLLVGVPSFLMGGTLPAAIRALAAGSRHLSETGGRVYAANTAGAIAGALFSTFGLLPWLGVRGTAFATAVINLLAAAIALALDRSLATRTYAVEKQALPSNNQSRIALALYAIAGGIALGYEVVWSQAMTQFLSTRVFAFSVMLATYLAGLAVGSALYARFAGRIRDPWGVFAMLISAAGVVALLEIAGLQLWQLRLQLNAGAFAYSVTGSELARMCAQFLVASIGIVFMPTLLLGAAFPAALQLAAGREHPGKDVGAIIGLNTAGGIAGTLLTGFFLVPVLGLVRTLSMLAIAAATVGGLAIVLGSHVSRKFRWIVCLLGCIALCAGILTPPDRLARLLLATRGGGELVFYAESRGATVAVAQQENNDHIFRRLYIQGVSNSGDAMPSLRYMRLQSLLPLIIHRGDPKSALVIGFGTGITAGALLRYPGLDRRVCVELLPAVAQAGSFFPENYRAVSDPRMQLRIADGRRELMRSTEKYDLITLEPPPPSAQGVVNLYSSDFYRLASRRLEPDGLFAQWLPLATQNDAETRSLVRSFLDVFPYATLWTSELHEMLLIGSNAPITLDVTQITSRLSQTGVKDALRAVGISSPASLLATWVTGRDALERYTANAQPVTDNYPHIEYAPWVRPKEITRTLPRLLSLRTDPPLIGADDTMRADVARESATLSNFYASGIAAYEGDKERWSTTIQAVMASDGDNPYYNWIIGSREPRGQ